MPATVIIPAHNESLVIEDNLRLVLDGLPGGIRVVVVPNGCTDDTADLARNVSPRVEVIELEAPSKTAALNAGDAVADGTRVYLDADVRIEAPCIVALVHAAESGDGASEPTAEFNTAHSSILVRWYYIVWTQLHGQTPGDTGTGVYCISLRGRQRFGAFPGVVSDDGFAKAHFATGELQRVDCSSIVAAPRRTGDLIRIKARSRSGNAELADRFPDLWRSKRTAGSSLGSKVKHLPVRTWPMVPVYVVVQGLARLRARRIAGKGRATVWERDEGSRSA